MLTVEEAMVVEAVALEVEASAEVVLEGVAVQGEATQLLQVEEEVVVATLHRQEATQHPPGVVEVAIPPPRGGGSLFPPLEVTTISNYYTILKLHLHHVCLAIFDF